MGVTGIFEELRKGIDGGDRLNVLEKFQNLILLGLSVQTDFFKHAAMFGGTSLRIFHNLPRFSEDLDFTVVSYDTDFSLVSYREPMSRFFADLGLEDVKISIKEEGEDVLRGSFLLSIKRSESLRVKIDVEKPSARVMPKTETLYGFYPYNYSARLCTLPSSFAGKMDAIIHRKWGSKRVKGRDWYDFLWYMRRNTELDINWLEARLKEKGTLDPEMKLMPELLGEMYEKRAASVDVGEILRDVQGFMTEALEKKSSNSWTPELFLRQKDKLVDSAKRYLLSNRS